MKPSVGDSRTRTVIVDAGPLKAAIDSGDVDHAWAVNALLSVSGRFVTCEAVIAEAQHCLENEPRGVKALHLIVQKMDVIPLGSRLDSVFLDAEPWAPRMDFADACVVHLVNSFDNAFALTTDFRDFSAYRIPFASPEGNFYPQTQGRR